MQVCALDSACVGDEMLSRADGHERARYSQRRVSGRTGALDSERWRWCAHSKNGARGQRAPMPGARSIDGAWFREASDASAGDSRSVEAGAGAGAAGAEEAATPAGGLG